MTAADLLAALTRAGCNPAADGAELVFDRPPPDLEPFLELLHTRVRAVLTGKRRHGCDRDTGDPCGPHPARGDGPLAFGALNPTALLPANVGLLCVAGDGAWDRIPRSAVTFLPSAFRLSEAEAVVRAAKPKRSDRAANRSR